MVIKKPLVMSQPEIGKPIRKLRLLTGMTQEQWKDYGCVCISNELAEIIDESRAREELILPYHI